MALSRQSNYDSSFDSRTIIPLTAQRRWLVTENAPSLSYMTEQLAANILIVS